MKYSTNKYTILNLEQIVHSIISFHEITTENKLMINIVLCINNYKSIFIN